MLFISRIGRNSRKQTLFICVIVVSEQSLARLAAQPASITSSSGSTMLMDRIRFSSMQTRFLSRFPDYPFSPLCASAHRKSACLRSVSSRSCASSSSTRAMTPSTIRFCFLLSLRPSRYARAISGRRFIVM